jgi:hypothetical protein
LPGDEQVERAIAAADQDGLPVANGQKATLTAADKTAFWYEASKPQRYRHERRRHKSPTRLETVLPNSG